jgi:hypothetical protein
MNQELTKDQIERLRLRDDAIDTLSRLKGMFGAVEYLMGGDRHPLNGEYEDFALWLGDIRGRIDGVIETVGGIR